MLLRHDGSRVVQYPQPRAPASLSGGVVERAQVHAHRRARVVDVAKRGVRKPGLQVQCRCVGRGGGALFELQGIGPEGAPLVGRDVDDPKDLAALLRREADVVPAPEIARAARREMPAKRYLLSLDGLAAMLIGAKRRYLEGGAGFGNVGLERYREGICLALLHDDRRAGTKLHAERTAEAVAFHRERRPQAGGAVHLGRVVEAEARQAVDVPAPHCIAMVDAKLEAAVRQHIACGFGRGRQAKQGPHGQRACDHQKAWDDDRHRLQKTPLRSDYSPGTARPRAAGLPGPTALAMARR